jgi:hypothetical protein
MVVKEKTMTNGTNDEYAEFDERAFSAALEAARQPYEGRELREVSDISAVDGGELELRAACIEVRSSNNEVCLKVPVAGRVCIPVPFDIPDGTAVRACASIRTKWGIPIGVCVTLYVAGEQIARKCYP